MSRNQAFALRADYEDIFVGGQLAYGVGQQTFDVGEELEKGGGVIIVELDDQSPPDQQMLADALSAYPALKHVPLAEAERRQQASREKAPVSAVHDPEEPVDDETARALAGQGTKSTKRGDAR